MNTFTKMAGIGMIISVLVTLTGCTTSAGPFVTSITSDGKGNIVVEKNTVIVNGITGTVTSGSNPQQEVIRVVPDTSAPQK
jgi:hypothetical protein